MADPANPDSVPELPPPPGAPWGTMLTTLVILFGFAGVLFVLQYVSSTMPGSPATAQSGEQRLQELRTAEQEHLNSSGFDPQSKTYNMPIERAMSILIEEGKAKGEMQSFPTKPKGK